MCWEAEVESDAAESSDQETPFQVSRRLWMFVALRESPVEEYEPTATQKLGPVHETPER